MSEQTDRPQSALDEIQTRCDAATKGPWKVGNGPYGWDDGIVTDDEKEDPIITNSGHDGTSPSAEDADFMAHARTDIPALLATVRAQGERICEMDNLVRSVELPHRIKSKLAAHGDGIYEQIVKLVTSFEALEAEREQFEGLWKKATMGVTAWRRR